MQLTPLCTPDVAVNAQPGEGTVHAIRCKRWSCPECAKVNRKRVMMKARDGHPTAMLTLTVSHKNYDDFGEAARDLKRGLVALRKRIARAYPGERLPFIAVFEKHKSGWPHLHLLIRARFLPIKRLKEMWEGITGSWNVSITAIKSNAGAMAYVAKYLGKDLSKFEGCKRWWRSHDYDQVEKDEKEGAQPRQNWSRWEASLPALRSAFRALGAEVHDEPGGAIRWRSPPDRLIYFGDAQRLIAAWWPRNAATRRGGR